MSISAFAERVLAALGETFVAKGGVGLPPLVDGLTIPLADIDQRATITPGGWAQLFDLATTPDPAWLGRTFGSKIPAGLSVEDARAFILGRAYWRRGTPAAIKAAVQAILGGSKTVTLIERDGSPWRLTIRVYSPDVPVGVTVDDIKAAAMAQKPVGIVLNCEIAEAATYGHFAAAHGPDYVDVAGDFATYGAARTHVPEEGTPA